MESILTSVKKLLGITEDYEHFDADIIMHINSVFMVLRQLGVGPENGFSITDKTTTWQDYAQNISEIEMVKSYVFLKVKMLFDPPLSGSVADGFNKLISELEFRLNAKEDIGESPTQ